MEPETMRAFEIVGIMERAKGSDVPDSLVYEDHIAIIQKKDGVVTLTGKPIKFPFIYMDMTT